MNQARTLFTTCAKLNVKILLTYDAGRKAANALVCIKLASPDGGGDQMNHF